jgi:Spy/CpxP family protein refolding chaperone
MRPLLQTASLRSALCALAAVLAFASASPLAEQAPAQGKFKWWQSDRYKTELMLTTDQSRRLEEIFQNALPTLRAQMKALESAETELERLVQRGDDSAVMAQVARVETARAELNTSRTLMLLKMRRLLTSDQWIKFGALHKALEHEREQALQRSNAAPK